jgi:hypothetical protein
MARATKYKKRHQNFKILILTELHSAYCFPAYRPCHILTTTSKFGDIDTTKLHTENLKHTLAMCHFFDASGGFSGCSCSSSTSTGTFRYSKIPTYASSPSANLASMLKFPSSSFLWEVFTWRETSWQCKKSTSSWSWLMREWCWLKNQVWMSL